MKKIVLFLVVSLVVLVCCVLLGNVIYRSFTYWDWTKTGHTRKIDMPIKIYDTKNDLFIDFNAMIKAVDKADVLYFGEVHDDVLQHKLMLKILKSVSTKYSVGFELIKKDKQQYLNDYLGGKITDSELYEKIGWTDVDQMFAYGPIFRYMQSRQVEGFAINLPENVQSLYQCDFENRYYKMVLNAISGPMLDQKKGKMFQHMKKYLGKYLIKMCGWNEFMADSIINLKPEKKKLVVITGQMHIILNDGIVKAVSKRNAKLTQKTIYMMSDGVSSTEKSVIEQVKTLGDYVVFFK